MGARPLWFPSYFGFLAILNTLSIKNLSESVPIAKYSKSF